MGPPYKPKTTGQTDGLPRVHVNNRPGHKDGFDAILFREYEEGGRKVATLWATKRGGWRTVEADRIERPKPPKAPRRKGKVVV